MTEYADIHLPYFKQGDDICFHLEDAKSNEEALESHARALEGGASILRAIKEKIKGKKVELDGMTHHIGISGSKKLIDELVGLGLAEPCHYEDEEYDVNMN